MLDSAMRPSFHWQLRTQSLELGPRTLVMAIVNVTPDSFSDGGDHFSTAVAVEHALECLKEGADILDIGGESTRPGKKEPVSEREELARVIPVVEGVRCHALHAVISIDTYRSGVAQAAIAAGAEIVNDVSALRWDPEMAKTLAELGCGAILMHMRGHPEEWRTQPPDPDIVSTVKRELAASAQFATTAGISREHVMLDPGFGFGKNFDENYPLLAHFAELHELRYPLLSGTSRKSFIGRTLSRAGHDAPMKARLSGTMATVTASVLAGAHAVRVHDVKAAVETVKIADAILRART